MLLTFDVGNTETTLGLYDGATLRAHWRIMTDVARTSDEFGVLLRGLLDGADVPIGDVTGVAIGSVVPPVTTPLAEACRRWLPATRVEVIDARSELPITLAVDEPLTVGADRIINTLAASRRYARDAIVVDLGTATTFDCITKDAVFLGGVIAPGVRSSAETLFRRTSKLPATELVAPPRVIGTRTEECIRAGVMFGAAESIDGIVRRIKAEWPAAEVPVVVGTGGLAELFAPLCRSFDEVDPYLTLYGLSLAYDLLASGRK
jgi:type III pantothenate kinase